MIFCTLFNWLLVLILISVRKAYQIICNICRAAAALWCGKDKFAEYCAKFTPKQNVLMCAILDYGSKFAKEADFPDLADKIDSEYFICSDIQKEMGMLISEDSNNIEYFL